MNVFIRDMTTSELIATYSNVTGKPVKRFENRTIAVKRVAAAIVETTGATYNDAAGVIYLPAGWRFDHDSNQLVAADPEPVKDDYPVPGEDPAPREKAARANSKQAGMIAMLRRPEGATIQEIAEAFGWQHHTVRGAIAGALKKKLGLDVTSEKVDGRGRVYRV